MPLAQKIIENGRDHLVTIASSALLHTCGMQLTGADKRSLEQLAMKVAELAGNAPDPYRLDSLQGIMGEEIGAIFSEHVVNLALAHLNNRRLITNIDKEAQDIFEKMRKTFERDRARVQEIYRSNAQRVPKEDEKSLHQHANKNRVWLTDAHMQQPLMPRDNAAFHILAPVRVDALYTHKDTIRNSFTEENKNVQAVLIPVSFGSDHWRAVYLERQPNNTFSVTLFDSFGSESAKDIAEGVRNQLGLPGDIHIGHIHTRD